VTEAHRELAKTLARSGIGDLLLWFPTGTRRDKDLTASVHRARMSELAFSDRWRQRLPIEFRLDLRDVHRPNPSTIDRMRELAQEFPDAEPCFAVGADAVVPKEKWGGKCDIAGYWNDGETLMRDFTFIVLPREGYPHPKDVDLPKHWHIHDVPSIPVSSTEVRRRVRANEPYAHLVPQEVAEYIRHNELYLN